MMATDQETAQHNKPDEPNNQKIDVSSYASRYRDLLEVASKVLIAISAISYITGFLILNMHLREYGVSQLSFAQSEYVIVGILWVFLTAYSFFVLDIFILPAYLAYKYNPKIIRDNFKIMKIIFIGMSPVCLLIIYLAYFLPLYPLSDGKIDLLSWKGIRIVINLMIGAASIQALMHSFGRISKIIKLRLEFIPILESFIIIIVIIGILSGYSKLVYPIMSSVYGGGNHQSIMTVIKTEQVDMLNNVGFKVSSGDRKLGPLEVIYEASDYFIICVPESMKGLERIKSIKLKKDMFDLVIYIDPDYKPIPTPTP
jgi:hypothetical protein